VCVCLGDDRVDFTTAVDANNSCAVSSVTRYHSDDTVTDRPRQPAERDVRPARLQRQSTGGRLFVCRRGTTPQRPADDHGRPTETERTRRSSAPSSVASSTPAVSFVLIHVLVMTHKETRSLGHTTHETTIEQMKIRTIMSGKNNKKISAYNKMA